MPDATLLDGRSDSLRRRGVVEIDRDLSQDGQSDIGESASGTGRQPNANHGRVAQQSLQLLCQNHGGGQYFTASKDFLGVRIDHAGPEWMACGHADELA